MPGMILERGAMGRDGRLLIGANTELNERLLSVLETAQIPIIYVTDASYEERNICPDLAPLSKKQEREIKGRFRHVDLEGAFAQAVFQECLLHEQAQNANNPEVAEER